MGLFEHFPYTNFHELNLAWLIEALRELERRVDEIDPGSSTEILAEIEAIKTRLTADEGAISALDLRMDQAEGTQTSQGTRLTALEGALTALTARVAALEAQTPAVAFIPVSGGVRVQMDNAGAVALADLNLGRPVEVTNSGTLTGGDASDAVEWIQAVLAAKAQGKIIQIYSPDYAYLTEVCYYKHSDAWIELNFSRPGFEDLTNHYDYDMGYFVDVNATDPANVDYKVTVSACALRFPT